MNVPTTNAKIAVAHMQHLIADYNKVNPWVWRNIAALQKTHYDKNAKIQWGTQGATTWTETGLVPEKFWPRWCYVPYLFCEHANILLETPPPFPTQEPPQHEIRNAILGCIVLGGWRLTQGAYVIDPYLGDELWKTSLSGKIPWEVLGHLPEWSVLVVLPPNTFKATLEEGEEAIAALCHLTMIGQYATLVFRLIYTGEISAMLSIPLLGTLEDSIGFISKCISNPTGGAELPDGLRVGYETDPETMSYAQKVYLQCTSDVAGLISTLLYLASAEPDVDKVVKQPTPVKTKHGMKVFPPTAPTYVNVGLHIGAVLKRHQARTEHDQAPGTHASPRPHIRAAHWHTFLTGSRLAPVPRVKWLPPIPINAHMGEIEPVVRPVLAL